MQYQPETFQHLAGLTAYYNTRNWHFLYVTADDGGMPVSRVATCDRGVVTIHAATAPAGDTVRLGLEIDGDELRFRCDGKDFGPVLDASILSDEHAAEFEGGRIRALGFTGTFAGLWVWDLTGHGHPANFEVSA